MKKSIKLLALIMSTAFVLSISSCQVEEKIEKEVTPTISNTTSEESNKIGRRPNTECPPVYVHSITPCGYGYNIKFVEWNGNLATWFSSQYSIYDAAGNLVDSGNVAHNSNTNWVLNPCQTYTIIIPAFCAGNTQILNVTSDGCGNIFLC